jgi:hypothetical protein
MDLAGLSVEECELLRRNTTGRFVDGEDTTPLTFLLPFPEVAALFSGLTLGRSGEGGCTTTRALDNSGSPESLSDS